MKYSARRKMLRFKAWSHKSYSAFVSCGRHVTIGVLRKGVADASLLKNPLPVVVTSASAAGLFDHDFYDPLDVGAVPLDERTAILEMNLAYVIGGTVCCAPAFAAYIPINYLETDRCHASSIYPFSRV